MNIYDEILEMFIRKYDPTDTSKYNQDLSHPFLSDPAHYVASDGVTAVRVTKDKVEGEYSPINNKRIMDLMPKMFGEDEYSGQFHITDLEGIYNLMGTQPVYEPCSNCDGEGEVMCACCGNIDDCEECDGSGVTDKVIGKEPKTFTLKLNYPDKTGELLYGPLPMYSLNFASGLLYRLLLVAQKLKAKEVKTRTKIQSGFYCYPVFKVTDDVEVIIMHRLDTEGKIKELNIDPL